MIHAVIIICKIASISSDCLILSDTLGPYKTKEKCEKRTEQMYTDARNVLSKYELNSSKCLTDNERDRFIKKYFKFALVKEFSKKKCGGYKIYRCRKNTEKHQRSIFKALIFSNHFQWLLFLNKTTALPFPSLL